MAAKTETIDTFDRWTVSDDLGRVEVVVKDYDGCGRITLTPEQARRLAEAISAAATMTERNEQ